MQKDVQKDCSSAILVMSGLNVTSWTMTVTYHEGIASRVMKKLQGIQSEIGYCIKATRPADASI